MRGEQSLENESHIHVFDQIREQLALWKNVHDSISSGDRTPEDAALLRQYTAKLNGLIIESGLADGQLEDIFPTQMAEFLKYAKREAESRAGRN